MLLSDTRFVQLVQSQNIGLCFRPEIEMLKYSQAGGFNDRFSGYWMYWLFMNFWLPGNFFEQPCPWVEVFIVCRSWENSCTTKAKHHLESFRISEQISNTLTGCNFNFNFVEIILWVSSVETSRFSSLYAQGLKFNQPQNQNYNWNRLTSKNYSFKKDRMRFSEEILDNLRLPVM